MRGIPVTTREVKRMIYFRKRGYSLPELRKLMGRGNATIFRYIKEIEILPEFKKIWENKRKPSVFRMIQEEQKAKKHARNILKDTKKREKMIIAACLYWAEGAKRDFSLSNTDPNLIKVFIECLKIFGVEKSDLKITIRVYEDLDIVSAVNFWAEIIGVSKSQILNINVLQGKKKGKLKYGMCRIRVAKGGYLLKLIKCIKDIVIESIICPRSSTDRAAHS